jgi:hypothetical protein
LFGRVLRASLAEGHVTPISSFHPLVRLGSGFPHFAVKLSPTDSGGNSTKVECLGIEGVAEYRDAPSEACGYLMLSAFLARLRPRPVTTAAGLRGFLAERAALVTQKCIIGYCHARTLLPMNELMRDPPFAAAFGNARRTGYAAVLEDLYVIAESRLRGGAGVRPDVLAERLTALFVTELRNGDPAAMPVEDPDVLGGQLGRRLAVAQLDPPRPIAEIAHVSAGRIYAAMPIHERLRAPDEAAIRASVRFMLVGMASAFDQRLDVPAICTELAQG